MRRRIEEPFLTAAGGGSVAAPGSVLVLWRQGVRAMGTRGVVAGCRGRLSFSAWGLAPSWHLACARRGPASLRPGVGAVAAHAAPHPATSSCCFWRSGPRIAPRYSWRPTTLRGSVGRPPVGLRGGWEAAGPKFLSALTWILTLENGPRLRPPLTPRLRPLPFPRYPWLRPNPTPRPRPPPLASARPHIPAPADTRPTLEGRVSDSMFRGGGELPASPTPRILILSCETKKLSSLSPFQRKEGCDRLGKVTRCDKLRDAGDRS